MLCAINYDYKKGYVKVEFIQCKTILVRLLCIAILESKSLRWVIEIFLIYIIVWYTWRGRLTAIVHLPTTILLFLLRFIFNYCGYFFSYKYRICSFVIFLKHNFFAAVKEIHKLRLRSTTTSAYTKFLLPKPRNHWKTYHYRGSVNRGEVDIDSDVNCLDSGNRRQSTTVPSQCEQSPWNWTCHLLYFDHWSHFKKRPGIFILLYASNYHCNKVPLKVECIKCKTIHI